MTYTDEEVKRLLYRNDMKNSDNQKSAEEFMNKTGRTFWEIMGLFGQVIKENGGLPDKGVSAIGAAKNVVCVETGEIFKSTNAAGVSAGVSREFMRRRILQSLPVRGKTYKYLEESIN